MRKPKGILDIRSINLKEMVAAEVIRGTPCLSTTGISVLVR